MKKNTVTGFLLAIALSAGFYAQAQTPEQKERIIKSYDLEKVKELRAQLVKKNEDNYKRALELAAVNGWPLRIVEDNGQVSVLKGVLNDKPLYISTFNDGNGGSAFTSRVTAIRPGGSMNLNLTGSGMTVGMWEIGPARTNHVDLTGRITVGDNAFFSSHNEETDHATHVAGTIMGSGIFSPNARGIAYEANLIAFNADNDDVEALDAATEDGLLVSNHSYGFKYDLMIGDFPWIAGAYSSEAVVWDQVTFAAPYYLPVISAGNDRSGKGEMRDLLIGNKVSKNVLTVAAVNALPFPSGYVSKNSVIMSDFSSYGPADDKRIKPDISAKGVGVFSASSEDTMAHAVKQGTSMAAPGVAGALILLQQHYSNVNDGNFMRAATLKALVINTADEAGTHDGPDFRFGWGLLNAEKAAKMILDEGAESIIEEQTLSPGGTYTLEVTAIGSRPLKATLSWTDPAGQNNDNMANDNNPDVRNNLNIKITKTGEADHLPWKLAPVVQNAAVKGVNDVDNVEKVEINNPSGNYLITINHSGNLFGFNPQAFSLVVDGAIDELGISDNELNSKISVYPNPATNVINITFDETLGTDNGQMELYDLQGRLVKQFDKLVDSIDVSNLSSGLYLLNINKDGATASKKIIIQ